MQKIRQRKEKIMMKKENRKQITSIIKGCSLVQFGHNCAVLCNHLIESLKLQDFM
ncbi:MAG: hypothetical protein WAL88_01600 [Nitrosotalea sp.]